MSARSSRRPLDDRMPLLLLVSCGLTLAAVVLLKVESKADAAALGPQAFAPPAFGVFFDLRWLLVYASSWPRFALEMVTAVVVRAAIITLFVRLAWPTDVVRPSVRTTSSRAVVFAALAPVALVPPASLLFGVAVVSVSWLFFAGLLPVLAIAGAIQPAAFVPKWWCRPITRSLLWAFLTFAVLTAGGAGAVILPMAFIPPFAIAAGAVNALLWRGIVSSAVRQPEPVRVRPVAPLAIATTVALLAAGVILGVGGGPDNGPSLQAGPPYPNGPRPAVMVIGGFGTAWDGVSQDLINHGIESAVFSYRGLSSDGRPLSYTEEDTHQPLVASARKLAEQVDASIAPPGSRSRWSARAKDR